MTWDGLLLVDKKPGCTSHDVVQAVRRLLGQRKIGHCGTLDPDATGLLVLTLGKATRLTRFLINAPKVYSGTIRFGIATDTYDASGQTTSESSTADLSNEAIAAIMQSFEGISEQAAPPFSAKKIKGVKYYELARKGEEVPTSAKRIEIFECTPSSELADQRIDFRLACASGTYVRSVAHDLGGQLGCGALLERLRRLKVGPFEIESALTLQVLGQLAAESADFGAAWIPFDQIPLPFLEVGTDAQQERRIIHGQTVLLRQTECEEGDWIKLTNQRHQLIAVGSVIERIGDRGVSVVQPRIVFR